MSTEGGKDRAATAREALRVGDKVWATDARWVGEVESRGPACVRVKHLDTGIVRVMPIARLERLGRLIDYVRELRGGRASLEAEIERLQTALAAYKSALRSGERETERLRALDRRGEGD